VTRINQVLGIRRHYTDGGTFPEFLTAATRDAQHKPIGAPLKNFWGFAA